MKLHVVKTTAAGGKEVSYYLSKVEDRLHQYMEHNEHLGSKYLKSAISNAERDIGRGFIDKKGERQRRKDLAKQPKMDSKASGDSLPYGTVT